MKILRKMTHLALAAAVAFGFSAASLVAQDPAPPAAPAAAPAAAAPAEPAAAPAAAPAAEAAPAEAAPAAPPALDPGHNAWQMTCTALVLFMTLPGLALFYGGLVRRKNVLS